MSEATKPKPKSKLTELQEQLQETEANYKRALADYQNLVKQTAKERQEYITYANSSLISQILPTLDNLILASQHLSDPGLDMVVKQFQQTLESEGLQSISPVVGEAFNPTHHECIDTVESADQPADTIAQTLQLGYKWKSGTVLRPAKVKVYKATEKQRNLETQEPENNH